MSAVFLGGEEVPLVGEVDIIFEHFADETCAPDTAEEVAGVFVFVDLDVPFRDGNLDFVRTFGSVRLVLFDPIFDFMGGSRNASGFVEQVSGVGEARVCGVGVVGDEVEVVASGFDEFFYVRDGVVSGGGATDLDGGIDGFHGF